MRISDWSSDVCSSDLKFVQRRQAKAAIGRAAQGEGIADPVERADPSGKLPVGAVGKAVVGRAGAAGAIEAVADRPAIRPRAAGQDQPAQRPVIRSEEHTSELQSLMRISYAVFSFKQKHKRLTQPMS